MYLITYYFGPGIARWLRYSARIYEVFLLLCPLCGGQMRLITFITEGTQIRRILDHIGLDSEPPRISPARAPPLRDECGDAQSDDGAQIEPDWDLAAQPAPGYEVDQRPTHPSQRYGFCLRRIFMVNLPHGREIQGSLVVRSLLLRPILRLVRLNGLSVYLYESTT